MDLVDIDKVLDDLELDEDQFIGGGGGGGGSHAPHQIQSSITATTTTAAAAGVVAGCTTKIEGISGTTNDGAAVTPQKTAQQQQQQQQQQQLKAFVNVANVFHSLNEYVNVEIDSNPKGYLNLTNERGRLDPRKMSLTTTTEDDLSSEPTSTYSSPSSMDIEKPKYVFNNSTTSGSVITSSASSPPSSPASTSSAASTSSSSSSKSLSSPRPTESTSPMIMSPSQQLQEFIPLATGENDQRKTVHDSMMDTSDPKPSEMVLSSVSSYCLNENNSASSTSFSDEMIMIDETQSLSSLNSRSHLPTTELTKDDEPVDGEKDPQMMHQPNGNQQQMSTKNQQCNNEPKNDVPKISAKSTMIVGFESTMDDVSDTELESYLQELELETSLHCAETSAAAAAAAAVPMASSNGSNSMEAELKGLEYCVVTSDIMDHHGEHPAAEIKDEKNIQNADSFSQASTVEYADVRLQSDFDQLPSSSEDIPESPVKHNLSVDIEHVDAEDEPEIERAEECSDTKPSENSIEKQLQRPNSLDILPQVDPGEQFIDAKRPPATEIEIVSTAVQTTTTTTTTPPKPNSKQQPDQQQDANPTLSSSTTSSSSSSSASSDDFQNSTNASNVTANQLGKVQPYWIPDNVTNCCMQCNVKFSVIKRRHHCRACGQVLCSTCCSLKAKLQYMGDVEARICVQCDILLNRDEAAGAAGGVDELGVPASPSGSNPNPNNPMEYCSVIPPHQQMAQLSQIPPISVMVPVGVLKREGASRANRKEKNVIFSDGIRPGCDLTELDGNPADRPSHYGSLKQGPSGSSRRVQTPPGPEDIYHQKRLKNKIGLPPIDHANQSFIPKSDDGLPPIYTETTRTEYRFIDMVNGAQLMQRLQMETLKFAIQRNFYVLVRIVKLSCCINKQVINFTTQGMTHVGQDEIVILLEIDGTMRLPKDIFLHLNDIYRDADHGTTITELGFSKSITTNFLDSKEHGGLLYIRPTFQCLQNLILPEYPFLIGVLIHRWEVPWAKVFPLRLMLRLGAMYRYYPCPHVSVRGRDSSYAEIAQTIINFLADFRTYSYTLPTIRGMFIHMEDRTTRVEIPKNRYDQIQKAINNSSDHILALGANFSQKADGHLVCIQNTESDCSETHSYSTQAVNIQGRPRKVTGASFLVLNGALKTTSGLSGKCSIVEDGLMVQILPAKMLAIHKALKEMKDIDIVCGPMDGDSAQTEVVKILWTDDDREFNVGVVSPIDNKSMTGIPSIRVHRGIEISNSNRILRWTEVFIIQSDEDAAHLKDPIDMSKLSEKIAQSALTALVSYLDLLAASGLIKIGLRTTIHQENVCYEAGSQKQKLAPLYMNALDNELIPMLHRQATNLQLETPITIELIFHILDE